MPAVATECHRFPPFPEVLFSRRFSRTSPFTDVILRKGPVLTGPVLNQIGMLQPPTYGIPKRTASGRTEVALWNASGMDEHVVGEPNGILEALFRASHSRLLGDVAALGTGAAFATSPGVEVVAGTVTQFGSTRSQWPAWVLVPVDAAGVDLFASDKKERTRGRQLLLAAPGTYRATLHQTLGKIQLLLFAPEHPALTLTSRSGLSSRGPLRLAQAVIEMAHTS